LSDLQPAVELGAGFDAQVNADFDDDADPHADSANDSMINVGGRAELGSEGCVGGKREPGGAPAAAVTSAATEW